MKIQAILEVFNSKSDSYGNRYFFARITSTLTGESFSYYTPHISNAEHDLKEAAGFEWGDFKTIEIELPIREYNRKEKFMTIELNSDKIKESITNLLKTEVSI